jgi:tetratricopeptide repeat protein 30
MIVEIVDRAMKDYPELGIGTASDGLLEESRSVGNTKALSESLIVEACNLKFAIEYKLKSVEAAADALKDMPQRKEEELDPVTLHNQALISKFYSYFATYPLK